MNCTGCQIRDCTISNIKPGKTPKCTIRQVLQSKESLKQSSFLEQGCLLPTWFKKCTVYKTVIRGSLLRGKALHITKRIGTEDFKINVDCINRFKQQHSTVYKTVLGECKSAESSNTEGMEEGTLHRISEGFITFKILMRMCCSSHCCLQRHQVQGDHCNGGKNSMDRITDLLTTNANGTDKLPLLVFGKCENPHCFNTVMKLPTKWGAIEKRGSHATCTEYLLALNAKMSTQNRLSCCEPLCCSPPRHKLPNTVKVLFFPKTAPIFSIYLNKE